MITSKKTKYLLSIFIAFFLGILTVFADGEPIGAHFCQDVAKTLYLGGLVIYFAKILVPLMIIVMASFDFAKSVTTGKEDDLKKNLMTAGKRLLIGIIVFFIPTFINLVFNMVSSDEKADYMVCMNCLTDPTGGTCE